MDERRDAPARPVAREDVLVRERLLNGCEKLLGPVDLLAPVVVSTGSTSCMIESGGRRLHAKLIRRGSARVLSLAVEFELLATLAREQLSPVPVAFDVDAGLLVTELLDGHRSLGSHELRDQQVLEWACALLARLHRQPAALSEYVPQDTALAYIDALGGAAALPARDRARADELLLLADEWPPGAAAMSLCHGDLVAANFMLGADLRLVDFEYAQVAAPVLDLASLSVMNDFTAADDERLLKAYFIDGPAPFSRDDFAKVRRMVALMAHFWALVQGPEDEEIARFLLERG